MNRRHLFDSAQSSFVIALILALVAATSYIILEPVVGRSATEIFEVTQSITGEISFLASTSPVTMNGAIAGVTGGSSWGTTTARVQTNNASGYSMTIKFASATAMYRDGGAGQIPNFQHSTSTANYGAGFTSAVYGQFGFSVNASNTSEISGIFTGDGSTVCGTGAGSTFVNNVCWRGPSTTPSGATQLINSSAATPTSGSTSTIQFHVVVPNNPNPAIPTGTYTATATLTATTNP